jgi:hypothetical protein
MPTATDLVTDLPADFEVFGQAVDTRLKALNPATTLGDITYASATANTNTRLPIGTNGQVLGVSGGVPAWVTDAAGMTNPMTTTGDTIYSSSGSTPARLGIGTTGQVLTVSGGLPSWAAAPGGSWSQSATGSLTGSSVTISSLSGKQYYVFLKQFSHNAGGSEYVQVRFNGDTGANYWRADSNTSVSELYTTGSGTFAPADAPSFGIHIDMADTSMAFKPVQNMTPKSVNGSVSGWYGSSSAITSITLYPSGGSFDNGTYYVWSFA